MLADVGLLGFPNVGKSSLLARVSAAKPKIADYHFTTLSPNLGVVALGGEGRGFVMADIPGLIDGAGLGHAFLRHVDRCRLLLHVVDISASEGRDPTEDMRIIDRELARYSEALASRPQIAVANKCDLADRESDAAKRFAAYCEELGRPLVFISAATGDGVRELMESVAKTLETLPPMTEYEAEISPEEEALAGVGCGIETTVRRENRTYFVEGKWIENFMGQINFDDYESLRFFQRVLDKNGVFALLREKGIEDGDTVNIYDFEFEYVQ